MRDPKAHLLLALDVGNTNTTLGLFRGKRLIAHGKMATAEISMRRQLKREVQRLQRSCRGPITAVIFSSVVPKATAPLKRSLKALLRLRPWVLGENVSAPVLNRYRIPSQVGQDRLCNAAAAFERHGGPVIVVDFGTAVTIDLVSARREYLGGVIVPGMEMALAALTDKAALLPRIKLKPPRRLLGRDTVSSIQSGIFFGYSGLCDGIIQRLKGGVAKSAKVIGTGGNAALIAPYCTSVHIVNQHLTLQGLELTYRQLTLKKS